MHFYYSLKFLAIIHVMMTAIPSVVLVYRYVFKRHVQSVTNMCGPPSISREISSFHRYELLSESLSF